METSRGRRFTQPTCPLPLSGGLVGLDTKEKQTRKAHCESRVAHTRPSLAEGTVVRDTFAAGDRPLWGHQSLSQVELRLVSSRFFQTDMSRLNTAGFRAMPSGLVFRSPEACHGFYHLYTSARWGDCIQDTKAL